MRTVYKVHDKRGHLLTDEWDPMSGPPTAAIWDHVYPENAPHTVVERQVAGPEDTDDLLRLRALVDDLRNAAGGNRDLALLLRSHGFGGPS